MTVRQTVLPTVAFQCIFAGRAVYLSPWGVDEPIGDDGVEIPVELVRSLLSLLRSRLGLETAWLSSFRDGMQTFEVLDGDTDTIGLSSGDRASLFDSYCVRVIDGRLPGIVPDTSANQTTDALPVTREFGLGAYVGVPVLNRNGGTVGMVCAVSREAKPYLADFDMRIVKQVAELIGTLIDSPENGRDTTAAQRAAIRRVVYQRDFEVVFQSVHDVPTGKVVGVEALARFPPREPFRPDGFLAQAALLGLGGIELETAIVARVISMVPQLPEDIFVAVNISPTAALVAPWEQMLADVDPSRIVLELTEHDAVLDYGALDDALEPCRTRGVRVAVDDVGAGFSSFSHVLELSPEFVKIDQSITRHIDVDDARRRLAHAIAELAGQMGATVIAEGVETQGELDAINAVGISAAQGVLPQPSTSSGARVPGCRRGSVDRSTSHRGGSVGRAPVRTGPCPFAHRHGCRGLGRDVPAHQPRPAQHARLHQTGTGRAHVSRDHPSRRSRRRHRAAH